MKHKENISSSDKEIKANLSLYFSWLPYCGILVSIFTTIGMLLRKEKWSLSLLFYIFIPIICFSLIALIISLLFKKSLNLSFPYFKGKKRYVTLFTILVFIILQVIIYIFNSKLEFTTVYVDDIKNIQETVNNEGHSKYYIIY